MASQASFDVSTGADLQEVDNAVNMATKEIANRYDFKGKTCTLELDRKAGAIKLDADDEYYLTALLNVLREKLSRRDHVADIHPQLCHLSGNLRPDIDIVPRLKRSHRHDAVVDVAARNRRGLAAVAAVGGGKPGLPYVIAATGQQRPSGNNRGSDERRPA